MTAPDISTPPAIGGNGGPPLDIDTDDIKMSWIKLDIADFKRGIANLDYEVRGYYITILVEMYDSKGRLPNDLALLGKRLGTTARVVKRVLDVLVGQGKVYVSGDWLRNKRCDEEREKLIAEYCRRHAAAVKREANRRQNADTKPKVSAKFAESLAEVSPKQSQNAGKFDGSFVETNGNSQAKTMNDAAEPWFNFDQSSAHNLEKKKKEEEKSKKEIVDLEPVQDPNRGRAYWAKAMAPPGGSLSDHNVRFENGKLELLNGFRADWLNRFGGDEERLDLAVTTAAAYVQPFGFKPLDIQVSAQLARHLADKRDKDERYAASAAKSGKGARGTKSNANTENEAERVVRLMTHGQSRKELGS